ncbi:hypothetical protein [Marinobacter sp. LN3S78]|uniref:hypothetical protein n=1 Tax=Marinobacter sp. LN3S78 TaxID=3382300 RepID=UPI00387B4D67
MIHGRIGPFVALIALAALLGACAHQSSTVVTDVQSTGQPSRGFSNILVVAANGNPEVRRAVGKALTDQIVRKGVSAFYLADDNDVLSWDNPAELRSQLLDIATKGQYDGVLVMSLVDKKHHENYQPETVSYIPDNRDIGPTASMTYMERSVQPASFKRSVEYVIQSTLYDGTNGNAVWRALSRTVDPDSLDKAAREFASVVAEALDAPLGQGGSQ